MNLFLKNLFYFFLPLILLAFPIDYFISNQLKNSDKHAFSETKVWRDIYSGKIDAEMVIYGSSRARKHINPLLLYDQLGITSYNLGIDGFGFWLQYLRHKEYLENNSKPKYVILSVDIFTLTKRPNLFNYEQFLPYMLFNKDMYDFTSSKAGFHVLDYYVPFLRYSGELPSVKEALNNIIIKRPSKNKDTKGFIALDKEWNNDLANAKDKMNYFEIKVDSTSIDLLNTFLNECKNLNIRVAMVYTPSFVKGQDFVKNRKEIVDQLKNIAQYYNSLYLDYSDHKLSQTKKYFYNSLHLNSKGAELFTKQLAKDLEEKQFFKSDLSQ